MRKLIIWIIAIKSLIELTWQVDIDVSQITKNDEIWLRVPEKFSVNYDRSVKDIEQTPPNLKAEIRKYSSTAIVENSCTLSTSTRISSDVFVALYCSNSIIVYKYNQNQQRTLFKVKSATLQGACSNMIYYGRSIVIPCRVTINGQEYLRCHLYNQDTDKLTNNQVLMNSPDIVSRPYAKIGKFSSSAGNNKDYILIYDKPLNTQIGTSSFNFVNNRAMYLVDPVTLTSSNLLLRNQPNVDTLSGVAIKNNKIYVTGYRRNDPVASRGKLFECDVTRTLVASSCRQKQLGSQISQGYFEIGIDLLGTNDRIYFYNDVSGKNVIGACEANVQSVSQIDSKCAYLTPITTTGVRAYEFNECRSDGCELVYEFQSTSKKAGIDYIKYNATSPGAGFFRRRFEADTVTSVSAVSGQEPWSFFARNRLVYLIDQKSVIDLLLNTQQIALGGLEISFKTLTGNTNTSVTNRVIGEVIEAKKIVDVKVFDINPKTNQGFYYQLPYRKDWLLGNNNIYSVEGTNQNSIVIYSNSLTPSLTNSGLKLDTMHPAGNSLVGITLNDLERTMLRIFSCEQEFLNQVKLSCMMTKEVPIKGRAPSIANYNTLVTQGKASPTSQPFIEEEFIYKVYNFELSLVVILKESVTNTLSLYSFDTTNWNMTFYNTTSEVEQFDMIEHDGELIFAFASKNKNRIHIFKTDNQDLGTIKKLVDLNKMLKDGDLCSSGFSLISGIKPKIRFLSQCAGQTLPVLLAEADLAASSNIASTFSYHEISRSSLSTLFSSQVTMCVSGGYSFFLNVNTNVVYGYSIPDTGAYFIDLPAWGMTNLLSIDCNLNSVTVTGLDAASLVTVATIMNKDLSNSNRRIHSVYKFPASTGYNIRATELGSSVFYTLNKTNSPQIFHRVEVDGPLIFTKTSTNVASSNINLKADNTFNSSVRSISISYVTPLLKTTVTKNTTTPLVAKQYDLESLATISGPVYSSKFNLQQADLLNFELFSRASLTKNMTNLSAIHPGEAHLAFAIKGPIGGLITKYKAVYYLNFFKDPDTLRSRFNISNPCNLIDVESDSNLNYAYAALSCLSNGKNMIFFYKGTVSPEQVNNGFGFYETDSDKENKEIRLMRVDTKVFLVFEMKNEQNEIMVKVADLENLSSSGVRVNKQDLLSVKLTTSYSIFSSDVYIALAYIVNYEGTVAIRFYSKSSKMLGNEIKFQLPTTIKLVKDFNCFDTTNSTLFSCVFISSGNFISEYSFEYQEKTSTVTQKSEIIYQIYKDFSAEKIKGNTLFFGVMGYSQSLKTNAILVYKRKGLGGSEYLYHGIKFSEFGAKTFKDVYYSFYRYFDQYKLYTKADPSFQTSVFRIGNYSVNILNPDIAAIRRATLQFPDSPNTPAMNIGDYFVVSNGSNSQTGQTPDNTNTSANNISTAIIITVVMVLITILFAAIGVYYFSGDQKLEFLKKKNSGKKKSGAYFDNVTIFDHSSKIDRNPVYEISKF